MEETKVTSKFQTTIPRKIRQFLNVRYGEEVEWSIVKGMVVLDTSKKMKNQLNF